MTADAFVDTNVLLYSVSKRAEDRSKRDDARALLARDHLAISSQVLQEFYVQAIRKGGLELPAHEAIAIMETFRRFLIVPVTPETVFKAVRLHGRHRINYWDAAILVSARDSGARLLYSEDLAHGHDYDGVIVENPFRSG